MPAIRECRDDEREKILAIVNAAAEAYRGVIPADCWHEPYMPREELDHEIAAGVAFWLLALALFFYRAVEAALSAAVPQYLKEGGHEEGQTIGTETHPFSDHEEVRKALQERAE